MTAAEPKQSRPQTSYLDQDAPAPLPWRWAQERLARARNYWLATTRGDGHPRARPVWGVWLDGALYFDSGSSVAILEREPRIELHLESGDEVVILSGIAEKVADETERQRFLEAFNPKYRWNWAPPAPPALYVLRPAKALGWLSDPTGEDWGNIFGATATRWTFGDD
ncbi:MAG: pyridoxamine 5'-phosphate oxidase family protein [Actinomycetota bacterium]